MSTALQFGLIAASAVGILLLMYFLASRSHRKPKPVPIVKKAVAQPWAKEKAGGRGNR